MGHNMDRGDLTNETVIFGETTFTINRALPMEAFNIFEELRPGLASISEVVRNALASEALGIDRNANAIGTVVEVIGKLPPEIIRILMTKLTKFVQFNRSELGSPAIVAHDPDSAFKDMTVFQIYELLARAFAVNFMESFDDLQSLLGELTPEDS